MKKIFIFAAFALTGIGSQAQQLPDFTGYPSLLFQINPAYTGTKGNLDARVAYRKQWVGYESAPVTQFVGVHSRLLKGKLGLGTTYYKDVTGPTRRTNFNFSAAYHLHLPDVEVSAGIGVNFNKYTYDGTMVTTHWVGDPIVDYSIVDYDKTKNVNAGLMLYNDRFHFGLGVTNIVNNKAEFYTADTTRYARVSFVPHYYFTCGYNFNANPAFVWENNLYGIYVAGLPMTIHYNLRVHYMEKIIAGASWRMKDAVALQAGYVLFERVQIMYSYDVGISHLRKGHSGSHEIVLGFRWDYHTSKDGYHNNKDFVRQKYNLF
jgi:type IX secretion system PorP/SprF family membrane protein